MIPETQKPTDHIYTRDEWLALSLAERGEINLPAYKALYTGEPIELWSGGGEWLRTTIVSLHFQYRAWPGIVKASRLRMVE